MVLQNLLQLVVHDRTRVLEDVLRSSGIDPGDVRLDAQGFTGEQRKLLAAACYVLARTMWADGHGSALEHQTAIAILRQFAGGRLSEKALEGELLKARTGEVTFDGLAIEVRHTLLNMALHVASADGVLASQEMHVLRNLTSRLGFAVDALDALLAEMRESPAAGESSTRDRHSEDRIGRRSPTREDEMQRARDLLGVARNADLMEVKRAYRQAMMRHHPDKAGADPGKQRANHRHAQEINWALELLERTVVSQSTG